MKSNEKCYIYHVGFNGNDQTEVDATCESEAIELAKTVAKESGLDFKLDYVEIYAEYEPPIDHDVYDEYQECELYI